MTHRLRRSNVLCALFLALSGATGSSNCKPDPPAPEPEPTRIGDADGSGGFDGADANYVRDAIVAGGVPEQPAYLADVAEPCSGLVDVEDHARLRLAVANLALGRRTRSQCHGTASIGDVSPTPRPDPEDMLPPRPPTLDDQFLAVAALVPQFGGAYLGANGSVKVVLTQTDMLAPAVTALIQVFGADGLPHDVFEPVQGQFGFAELQAARGVARGLMGLPGVASVDVDEVENQVVVGLADMGLRPQLETALAAAGVDLALVKLVPEQLPSDHANWGGKYLGAAGGCTIGFGARYATEFGLVTNAHCGAVIGTPETSYVDAAADPIGTESAEAAVVTAADDPLCPPGAECLHADVTFVKLDPGAQSERGRIKRYFGAPDYRIVQEAHFSWVGQPVRKSGVTTAETVGEITETCIDSNSGGYTKLCQDRASYLADSGDSGSPVFRIVSGTDVELHGIHWGGYGGQSISYFSPLHQIHYELAPIWGLLLTFGNEPPSIDFLEPNDGDAVVGSLVPTTFKAFYWDVEDGFGCPTCEIDWTSSLSGFLGTTPVVQAFVQDSFVLSGGQPQKLLATARDSDGDETTAAIWLTDGTATPSVTILEPSEGKQLWKGATYMYEGTSFDPDFFGPLPCTSLTWTLPTSGTGASGCGAEHTIAQTGSYVVGLEGEKPGTSVSASDSVGIQVVEPPQDAPPHVVIVRPGEGVGLTPAYEISIKGRIQDFDEAGPVQYEWVLKHGSVETVLEAGTIPNHEYTTTFWNVGNFFYVPPASPSEAAGKQPIGCGGTTVELELRGTDADSDTSSDSVSVWIEGPVC